MKKNILLLCSFAATAPVHSATLLYSSDTDFGQVVAASGNSLSVVGWAGFFGRAEADPAAVNTTAAPHASGNTYKIGAFNNTSTTGVEDYLYFQKDAGDTSMDLFAHTSSGSNFASFSPASYSAGLSAVWRQNGDASATGTYYATVLIGDTWYASTTGIASNGSFATRSFDFLAGSWVEVFDDLAAPLALGTATTDSATLFDGETIDGFGFFVENITAAASSGTNRTLRIDDIRIEGVPEPTSALLAFCGLGTILLRRKR